MENNKIVFSTSFDRKAGAVYFIIIMLSLCWTGMNSESSLQEKIVAIIGFLCFVIFTALIFYRRFILFHNKLQIRYAMNILKVEVNLNDINSMIIYDFRTRGIIPYLEINYKNAKKKKFYYGIVVLGDMEKLCEFLSNNGVSCKYVTNEGFLK